MHARSRLTFSHRQLLASRALEMRHTPTASEQFLWSARSGKKTGTVFRRQVVVGRFIVDFLAPQERLVVEVDGGYHGGRVRLDERRDRELARLGYRVLRLESELVLGQLPVALARIQDALRPCGSPAGGSHGDREPPQALRATMTDGTTAMKRAPSECALRKRLPDWVESALSHAVGVASVTLSDVRVRRLASEMERLQTELGPVW